MLLRGFYSYRSDPLNPIIMALTALENRRWAPKVGTYFDKYSSVDSVDTQKCEPCRDSVHGASGTP